MLGIRLDTEEYGVKTDKKEFFLSCYVKEFCCYILENIFKLNVTKKEFSSCIECFVIVSDDYGYGFTLYDPYGMGERRIR